MLDSAVQQHESAICIHIPLLSWASLPLLPHPTPLGSAPILEKRMLRPREGTGCQCSCGPSNNHDYLTVVKHSPMLEYLHMSNRWIHSTTPWGRYHNYLHFTDKKQTKLSSSSRVAVNNWWLNLVPPICQGKNKSTGKEIFVGRNILLTLFGMGEKDLTKMEITDVIEYEKNYNDLS